MSAYYSEFDPFAAEWLRQLIKAGHIAPGEVDERSIEDVLPSDLRPFKQCHFFAGIGVWSYALRKAGWPDDREVWTGSCPCQPFSAAGKRGGVTDARHLWPSLFGLVRINRPPVLFGEQVASKDGLSWLDSVQTDMEAANYSFGALDLCAAGFGAPHIRQRLYFVADSERRGMEERWRVEGGGEESNIGRRVFSRFPSSLPEQTGAVVEVLRERGITPGEAFWGDEPEPMAVAHGAINRVGRLRGYGNALCAPVAQGFIEAYMETL